MRRYAETFYRLDTDEVRGSDFFAEADAVLSEAEKLGKAEWFGGFLNELAEAIRRNKAAEITRKVGEPVHLRLKDVPSGKSYLKEVASNLRDARTGLGHLKPGTFFSFAVNMWGDDGPYCVLSAAEDALEAVRVARTTDGAPAQPLYQLAPKRYCVRFFIDRPPAGIAIEVGTRLGIRFNNQDRSAAIEMPSENPSPWPDSPGIVPWTDVQARGHAGRTPLNEAAFRGPSGLISGLVAAGSDVMSRDENGETPLHRAAFIASPDVLAVLVAEGAEVSARNHDGETPLHKATSVGTLPGIRTLLQAGADVMARGLGGRTPLHAAASCARSAVVAALLEAGARLEARDDFDDTSLHMAARRGKRDIVKELLDAGASVTARGMSGRTPLHWAASDAPNCDVIETLLCARADLEARDDLDRTPLHHAVAKGQPAVVKTLLEAGADLLAMSGLGKTPWDLSRARANADARFSASGAYQLMESLARGRKE